MKNNKTQALTPFFGLSGIVTIIDQLSKMWIVKNLALNEKINVLPGIFDITFVTNTGAAFGIFSGAESWRKTFFLSVTLAAMVFIIYFYKHSRNATPFLLFGTSLIFGGALGNLIDRIRYSLVIDFLDFYINKWHWPAFNIADSAITVGAILLAIHFLKDH